MSVPQKNDDKMDYEAIYHEKFLKVALRDLSETEIDQYVASVPEQYQKHYRQALTNPKNKANARKMKCLECSGWQPTEVCYCRVYECPLWMTRPYQARLKKGLDKEI